MDWFEAISENFMDSGGRPLSILEKVRGRYPVALHGTSLSIGSADPLRPEYLKRLKALVDRIEPFIVSDHLCWSSVQGEELHDLLPLPMTEEAVKHVVERVKKVQDYLGRQILLENVSTYVTYQHSAMAEWEFLREIAERSGCGILLDLNNIYVNAFNHKFDAKEYLRNIPAEKVGQFHLAGHTDMGKFLFDTHTGQIIDPVWDLYREALKLYGKVPTLIEWDEAIPEWAVLAEEAERARKIYREFEGEAEALNGKNDSARFSISLSERSRSENLEPWSLSETEQRFKTWIQPGKEKLDCRLNPQGGDQGAERLEVYAGGYTARIHEALSEVYEAVKKVIGPANFTELAEAYALRYPSKHYNLSYAGKNLPEFLKTWELGNAWPFLPDLAELEWKIVTAFHAFDEKPFDLSSLAGMAPDDWEKSRLVFQPSVQLIHSEWPVLDIWGVRKKPVHEIRLDVAGRPQWALIFRAGTEIRTRILQPREHILMTQLMKGMPLGQALEIAALPEEESGMIQEWFQFWAAAGLIANLKVLQNTPQD